MNYIKYTKIDHRQPVGNVQQIDIQAMPGRDITIYLVSFLPYFHMYSSILVVTDQFSKMVHLIALGKWIDASSLANRFFREMVHLHGLPSCIISNCNLCYISEFW